MTLFDFSPSGRGAKRLHIDWNVWVIMASNLWNTDESTFWIEKENVGVISSDQFGPSYHTKFNLISYTRTNVIELNLDGHQNTPRDIKGIPIAVILADDSYDPQMKIDGVAGSMSEFVSDIHEHVKVNTLTLAQYAQGLKNISQLTSLTDDQVAGIMGFDADAFKLQMSVLQAKIDALSAIEVKVSGEVTTVVEQQGQSFWEKLIGGIASVGLGALGAGLKTAIETKGQIKTALTESVTGMAENIASSALGEGTKTLGGTLGKLQTASHLLENKLRQVQNQVLGKFQTLDHITNTIDTIKTWADPKGETKGIDDRVKETSTLLKAYDYLFTDDTKHELDDMRVFIRSLRAKQIQHGDSDFATYLNRFWTEFEKIDQNEQATQSLSLDLSTTKAGLERFDGKRLWNRSNDMAAVVAVIDSKVTGLENLYGTGGLKVTYNTGYNVPLPL